jgi:hypothetical protein
MAKQSEIRFKIALNDNNVPQDIKWLATDTQKRRIARLQIDYDFDLGCTSKRNIEN